MVVFQAPSLIFTTAQPRRQVAIGNCVLKPTLYLMSFPQMLHAHSESRETCRRRP